MKTRFTAALHNVRPRPFADLPIKRKLILILMAVTGIALAVAGIGIVFADAALFRGYLKRDLTALAEMVADNSTAALAFDDAKSAAETLAALHARPHLVKACIYRRDGTVLATYARQGSDALCPPVSLLQEVRFEPEGILVSHPIRLSRRTIGTVQILYDLGELGERRRLYGGTVLAVLGLSSFLAFLFSSRLLTLVATPISRLAATASAVSQTQDYGIRAEKISGDELGILVQAFNKMLESIQSRDDRLKKALGDREDALQEAQSAGDSLKTTLASIADAVISTNVEGRIVFANRVAHQLLQFNEGELRGKDLAAVFRLVNEISRAEVENPVLRLLGGVSARAVSYDDVLVGRDGTETPIDHSVALIRADNGVVQGAVLVFRDSTTRRRAEETSRLLAAIVESSDDAIIGHALNGSITSWNHGAEQIFGYRAAEAIGRPARMLTAPGLEDEMPEILRRVAAGERIRQYQALRGTKDGRVIRVSLTVSPLYDSLGRIIGASKIARDITEQVHAAERLACLYADLQRTNDRLTRSNEDLERFAFVASHDLQEPLRMITAYSQLLVKRFSKEQDEDAAEFVRHIVAGTRRMRELLGDLLAFAEVDAPVERLRRGVDLNTVIENVKENLKLSIEDSGAMITAECLPRLRVYEGHCTPLFQNLIGNAIKYRGEGKAPHIHVSMERVDGQFRFAVADDGIGIPADSHVEIFLAFKRLHGRTVPGTGIGLAICQRIVERYGGRIWVESQPGKGSTFLFTLPGDLDMPEGMTE